MSTEKVTDRLSAAVCEVLRTCGTGVLDDPRSFYGALSDLVPGSSQEMRVLRSALVDDKDANLLTGLSRLNGSSSAADVRNAAQRIDRRLEDTHMRAEAVSRSCANGLALGMARYLGIEASGDLFETPQPPKPEPKPKPKPKPVRGSDVSVTIMVGEREAAAGTSQNVSYRLPSSGESKNLLVKIPAGIADGGKVRCVGAGEPGQHGGKSGDLIVVVRIKKEPAQPSNQVTPPAQAPTTGKAKPKGKFLTARNVILLLVLWTFAVSTWEMFGWLRGLEDTAWVMTKSKTTLANGTVSSEYTYQHDAYGNTTESSHWFLTEEGDRYEGTDEYYVFSAGAERGYAKYHKSRLTVTAPGNKVESIYETIEENDWRCDFSGRLHSKVVDSKTTYMNGEGEQTLDPDHTKELYTYSYSNDIASLLKGLWKIKSSDDITAEVEIVYDKHLNEKEYDYKSDDGTTKSTYSMYSSFTYNDDVLEKRIDHISSTYRSDTYSDYSQYKYEYEYDEHGCVVKKTITEDDTETVTEYRNEYDSNDNLVKRTNLTDGSVTEYEYAYIPKPSLAVRSGIR